MSYETIKLNIDGRLATLALNRPQAMNAMDIVMMKELADCFEFLQTQNEVQVLVIKGEGKVFSAGGDIKMMLSNDLPIDFEEIMSYLTRFVTAYYQLPMITIAQIHGASAGLGLSLALASDIIVAEESSKIAMNFIGIGLVPDGGGHFFMKERLGIPKAKQVIWEGKVMDGQEAQDLGLVDYLVPEGAAYVGTSKIVDKLLHSPITAMIETKKILHSEKLEELKSILEKEAVSQMRMRSTADHREGITAFVEKRKPNFSGK